jgi:GNAT superfamily N-acetyltransferase
MSYRLRDAMLDDAPLIRDLIARSAHGLRGDDYTAAQIDGALKGAFGVDTSLIRDHTYYVVETESGQIVACGGWGRRKTLFGSDSRAERDASFLDPARDAAKIRAFFVDPEHARHGLGRMLLEHSEQAAMRAGFTVFEMMATMPGMRFYLKHGYLPDQGIDYPLPGGLTIRFVPMRKSAPRSLQF